MIINNEEIFFVDIPQDSELILLYAPLRSYLGKIKKELALIIQQNSNAIAECFFTELRKRPLIDIYAAHRRAVDVMPLLSIPITDDCNMKCEYCYFRAGDNDKTLTQSDEQIKSYVDAYFEKISTYAIRNRDNSVDISIAGGGEPTSHFATFKYAVEYIEQKCKMVGLMPRFNMPTNGAYGKEIREFIAHHFDQVSLSFDGPEHIQNLHRPFKNGCGSFDLVFQTAKYFYEHELKFAFRATVSNYSVKYINDIIDFFAEHFPGKTVGFEPLNLFGRAVGNPKLLPPEPNEYANRLLDAYNYANTKNITLKTAGVGKFDTLRTVFCGAVGVPNWTITTDGRITSCTRDNLPDIFSFGVFNPETKKIDLDEDRVTAIRNLNIFNYPECQDCFCKYNCAGDCPDLRIADMINCEATKKIGAYVLYKKSEEVKV